MKRNYIYGTVLFVIACHVFMSCKKDNGSLSTVNTLPVIYLSSTAATLGISVESDGGSHITECGIYIATSQNPEKSGQRFQIGSDTGTFIGQLTGLLPEVQYFVKSYSQNEKGESLGNQVDFTTPGTVNDIDNNTYETVKIVDQIWLASNLKATSYRNGDPIETTAPANADITGESAPKYQWAYEGDEINAHTYGRVYTGHAVTDARGICPTGWHVPSDTEWATLTNALGGEEVAGGLMKEVGIIHWDSPNTKATDISLFAALPGGGREEAGSFSNTALGQFGWFWTSTFENITQLSWILRYDDGTANRMYTSRGAGFSVRCVKD
jgi:uncharacterized protein (TIGR02145 family)